MSTPMCSAQHCSGVSQQINDTCKANSWPVNHLVLVCDSTGYCCNCTCSCLAFDTPVTVSAGQTRAIQSFKLDDPVLAYDPSGASEQRSVAFSDGTNATSVQPEMAYVSFKTGTEERTVTVTLNHTFLLAATRKLIQAQMLGAGMELLLADGTTTSVTALAIKSYTGGVWNIATAIGKPANLDGHLIDTDGILSGDFAVQLYYDDLVKEGYATPSGTYPAVNSRGHDLAQEARTRKSVSARPRQDLLHFMKTATGHHHAIRRSGAGGVTLQGDHSFTLELPKATVNEGYLTETQALELQAGGLHPVNRDPQRAGYCLWLLKMFHAFYPDIEFILDSSSREANGYAFYLGGTKYIVIQGGLVRAVPLEWSGLALVLGYLVSRFSKDTQGADFLVCKPQADYLGPSVLQTVFNPLYPDVIFDAINQVEATFKLIPTKADAPVVGCHPTDLECRVETYRRAIGFNPLPVCAGGPPAADLRLLSAAPLYGSCPDIKLTFSADLDKASAEDKDNYFFGPEASVGGIVVAGNTVTIGGNFLQNVPYKVTVSDIKSSSGNTLDPQYVSTGFIIH